jgi:hypothetical protein
MNGPSEAKGKHAKARNRRGGPTKAQQAARSGILAEAGLGAAPEELEAAERGLRGG